MSKPNAKMSKMITSTAVFYPGTRFYKQMPRENYGALSKRDTSQQHHL